MNKQKSPQEEFTKQSWQSQAKRFDCESVQIIIRFLLYTQKDQVNFRLLRKSSNIKDWWTVRQEGAVLVAAEWSW